jgi:TolB-like protein/Flp pilus assembly protein TadD
MLAVLPFENLSPDPDQEYFSDGLTEELTSKLSLVQSLCVISRSSSMTFKGSNKTIPEIARALKVQYVVEGSVRKAGNELRITAQLIDANADAHIWSKSYTGTLADVFDMQDSVSQAIVDGIKVQLTPDETRRVKKRGIDDVDAYILYLKGVNGIYEGTADELRKGLRSLEQSQAIIGDNALLYSGMAWGLYMLVNNGLGQEEDIATCEEYTKKALTLDPELPEAHAMLGWINSSFLGNQAQAVKHFKTALTLDPNSENALWGLAVVYFMCIGRVPEAIALSDKYLLLNPQDSLQLYIQRGDIQFYAGDFPQALVWLRKSYLVGNRQPIDILMYAMALATCDSVEEALVVLNEAKRMDSSGTIAEFDQVLLFALRNDLSSALRALSSELQRTCRRDAGWSYTLGAVLAKAGATEEAFAWMENGVSRGFSNYPFMQKDPFLNNLRGEERFKKIMERVKYEWEHFEP